MSVLDSWTCVMRQGLWIHPKQTLFTIHVNLNIVRLIREVQSVKAAWHEEVELTAVLRLKQIQLTRGSRFVPSKLCSKLNIYIWMELWNSSIEAQANQGVKALWFSTKLNIFLPVNLWQMHKWVVSVNMSICSSQSLGKLPELGDLRGHYAWCSQTQKALKTPPRRGPQGSTPPWPTPTTLPICAPLMCLRHPELISVGSGA